MKSSQKRLILSKYAAPFQDHTRIDGKYEGRNSMTKNLTKCISDDKSMLFFIQYNEETSTFSDYYIEITTPYFGDDLDHRKKVNVTTFLLRGMPVVDHVVN